MMTRKKSILALVLALGLLTSACGGTPSPAQAESRPGNPVPAAFSAAPAAGEPAAPPPSAGVQSSAPEQGLPDDSLPPETPAEASEERPELPSPSSVDDRPAEPSKPPQSSLPEEGLPSKSSSQPEPPSDSAPEQADAAEAPPAQEQEDPSGSRWLTISEATALALINKERGRLGVQPLTFDPDLTAAARVRAAEMFRGNYLSPSRPDGSHWETVLQEDVPVAFSLTAENRAWTDHAVGQDVPPFQWFQMWQQSESQYAVMVDPRYTCCGIAVLAGPYFDGEQSYAVALFCSY